MSRRYTESRSLFGVRCKTARGAVRLALDTNGGTFTTTLFATARNLARGLNDESRRYRTGATYRAVRLTVTYAIEGQG